MQTILQCLDTLSDVKQLRKWDEVYEQYRTFSQSDGHQLPLLKQSLRTPLEDAFVLHKIFIVNLTSHLGVPFDEILPELEYLAVHGESEGRGYAVGWIVGGIENKDIICKSLNKINRERRFGLSDNLMLFLEFWRKSHSLKTSMRMFRKVHTDLREKGVDSH